MDTSPTQEVMMNWDCKNVDNDETFDRVEAIERASDDPIFSLSFGEFISLVRGLSGRLASKRARNWPRRLVGRFDDGSSVQMVYNTNDGTRNRLRVWPIAGLNDLYVDSSRHLVERTSAGMFRRAGHLNFTPERHREINAAIQAHLAAL